MLIGLFVTAGLLGRLQHPFGALQRGVNVYALDGWLIQVERDRFTDQVRCRLSEPHVNYRSGAVRFRFDSHVSTLGAWYRVDGGAPRRWQDVYPALSELGAIADGPSLDNPTGGEVALPLSEVASAHAVTIRAARNSRPRTFRVSGLQRALDAARNQGCTPDTVFVP